MKLLHDIYKWPSSTFYEVWFLSELLYIVQSIASVTAVVPCTKYGSYHSCCTLYKVWFLSQLLHIILSSSFLSSSLFPGSFSLSLYLSHVQAEMFMHSITYADAHCICPLRHTHTILHCQVG